MLDRKELKAAAKAQIKGNIGILFLCMLVMFIVVAVVSGLISAVTILSDNLVMVTVFTLLGSLLLIIVTPPFMVSFAMIYLNLREGQRPEVGHIFKGFSITGKSIWLYIIMQVFITLWSLLLIIPGIIKTYAYLLCFYVLAENQNMTARQALSESKRITKGYKMSLFVLGLSFILWGLLCVVTLGFAGIYVVPYIEATYANAYKKIQAEQAEGAPEVLEA